MCLSPVKIYNPTHRIGLNYNQRYEIEVPCGECAECRDTKKDEWYLRTYWQCKQAWDAGGYILFDTLTYNNENLPHISDFIDFERYDIEIVRDSVKAAYSIIDRGKKKLKDENPGLYSHLNVSCFNTDHYRKFFVRLRRALDYRGYDSTKLKYFLTSEYGSTEGLTHRPHYHILFFVEDRSLSPITLSNMINRCWQKGRTDGAPYKGNGYVLNKRVFGRGYNEDEIHMRAVCNYVAKYVLKDAEFQKVIDERLKDLFNYMVGNNEWTDKQQELYNKLVHEVQQFHRQSKGFGEYALSEFDEDVIKTGMLWIADSKKVKKHIPIPQYYINKIFRDTYKDDKGKIHSYWNENGVYWKVCRLKDNIGRMDKRMNEWYNNILLKYDLTDDWFKKYYPDAEKFKDLIDNLLDGRSWRDYAIYSLIYKGRVRSDYARHNNCKDPIENVVANMYRCLRDEDFTEVNCWCNYSTKTTRKVWKCNFLTSASIGEFIDTKDGKLWSGPYKYLDVGYDRLSDVNKGSIQDAVQKGGYVFLQPYTFKMMYCYNERSDKSFRDFDKIFDLYCKFNEGINESKQKAYEMKEGLKKKFKDNGLNHKNI